MDQRAEGGWRRLAAGAVDYGIVAAYIGLLAVVGTLLRAAGLLPSDLTTPAGRILGQLAAIAVLTLPVTVWFAWWEAAPRGATPGKRLLGLRVSGLGGGGLSWSRSLLRSAVKIAVPWELAHSGDHRCAAGSGGPGRSTSARVNPTWSSQVEGAPHDLAARGVRVHPPGLGELLD